MRLVSYLLNLKILKYFIIKIVSGICIIGASAITTEATLLFFKTKLFKKKLRDRS